MMDPNDKWVWADEPDSSPQALPLLDRKLTTIVEWPDLPPDPPIAEPPEPPARVVQDIPDPASIPEVAVEAPAPSSANGRRDISSTVVKATVLHLEGQIE